MASLPSFSWPILISIFSLCAVVVWVSGTWISDATDVLTFRWGMGEALGGLILLAIVTNLPEIAITVSAARRGNIGLAVGNLLGGIAIQTVVLAFLDGFGRPNGRLTGRPLSYRASSLALVLEGLCVLGVLSLVIMGHELPNTIYFHVGGPAEAAILVTWIASLVVVGRARTDLPWHNRGHAPDAQEHPRGHRRIIKSRTAFWQRSGTAKLILVFTVGALATLAAGVLLEGASEVMAGRIGMTGVLFGATLLAAVTSLPEITTGLTSVRLGDDRMAVSDIFGGNAFLPVLFVVASSLMDESVIPLAQKTDIYLVGLGMILTLVYVGGLIFRPKKKILGLGPDSWVVVILYAVGVMGLALI